MLWLWRVCAVLAVVFVATIVVELISGWGHPWIFVYPAAAFGPLAVVTWSRGCDGERQPHDVMRAKS
ncbi:hypothetical protein [Mycolicibacterium aromaticivorans]|uniref:hypothetical protein n=1 Tax=Mycolicibacterium aromaticivorans TaxID=318425 RepID=UPI00103CF1D6|nr:hypothetical protein [Mycolicibacterium aromaticivorans]